MNYNNAKLPFSLSQIACLRLDVLLGSLMINLLSLAMPLVVLLVYDRVIPNESLDTFSLLVLGILIVCFFDLVLRWARSRITSLAGADFEFTAANFALQKFLLAKIEDVEKKSPEVHFQSLTAIESLRELYSGQLIISLSDVPFILVFLIVIYLIGGELVLAPIAVLFFALLFTLKIGDMINRVTRLRDSLDETRSNFLFKVFSGMSTVKSLGLEAQICRQHEYIRAPLAHTIYKYCFVTIAGQSIGSMFGSLSMVATVVVGSVMVLEGSFTTGSLVACMMLAGRTAQPLVKMISLWGHSQSLLLARTRLDQVLKIAQESKPDIHDDKTPDLSGLIQLAGVCVNHGSAERLALDNVDLEILPGETIAIIGESGNGQATFLDLLSGLATPDKGFLMFDGVDSRFVDFNKIRHQIGFVSLSAPLYNGSILENLCKFQNVESTEFVLRFVRKLGLDSAISQMKSGLQTLVGEANPPPISKYVNQLISISRALSDDPRLILFDGTQDMLEPQNAINVCSTLADHAGLATMILVTSNPDLIALADRVILFERGRAYEVSKKETLESYQNPNGFHESHDSRSQPPSTSEKTQTAFLDLVLRQDVQKNLTEDYIEILSSRFGHEPHATQWVSSLIVFLEALEWHGNPRSLAEALPFRCHQLDQELIIEILSRLGFRIEQQSARLSDIPSNKCPFLFITNKGAPVVVTERDEKGWELFDSSKGGHIYSDDDYPEGVVISAQSKKVYGNTKTSPNEWLRWCIGLFKPLFLRIMVTSFAISLISISTPLIVMAVYDQVLGKEADQLIPFLLAAIALIVIFEIGLKLVRAHAQAQLCARVDYLVGNRLFETILHLPPSFTTGASITGQISRLKEFELFRDLFSGPLSSAIMELPFLVILLAVFFVISGPLALVPFAAVGVFGLFAIVTYPILRRRLFKYSAAHEHSRQFLMEAIRLLRSIKNIGAENVWAHRFNRILKQTVTSSLEVSKLQNDMQNVSQALTMLTVIVTLWYGTHLVIDDKMTMGALVGCIMLTWRILMPLSNLFSIASRLDQAKKTISKVDALLGYTREQEPGDAPTAIIDFAGRLKFSRVSMLYGPNTKPAVSGINFTLHPGEFLTIKGANGTGKSTLAKLALGMYRPQAGTVLLDGIDICQLRPITLRQTIAYLPQQIHIFNGTILENIALSDPTASFDKIKNACETAGLLDSIERLPHGFDTSFNEGALEHLPKAFLRKIGFARALLREASILIIDEPAGLVSPSDEKAFFTVIEKIRRTRSIILITQNENYIQCSDRVLILDDGQITYMGDPNDTPGANRRLKKVN